MGKVVLLLDDKPNIRKDLGSRLEQNGYAVHKAETIEESKKIILSEKIDYAIIDLKVDYQSEVGGIEVVGFAKRHQPKAKTIVLSGWDISDVDIPDDLKNQVDRFVSKKGPTNYILAVLQALNELIGQQEKKHCFVIMPFSSTQSCTKEEWTEIFDEVIKPAIEKSGHGYVCTRSNPVQGSIIEDILDNLDRADLVVADLTDRNPNVFYELGVRHSLRDSTILLTQRLKDIPFDLRPYVVQEYSWKTKPARRKFFTLMKEIVRRIDADPKAGASPIRKYLQI